MIPPFLVGVISLAHQGLSSGERIAHLSCLGSNSWLHCLLVQEFDKALKPAFKAGLFKVSAS